MADCGWERAAACLTQSRKVSLHEEAGQTQLRMLCSIMLASGLGCHEHSSGTCIGKYGVQGRPMNIQAMEEHGEIVVHAAKHQVLNCLERSLPSIFSLFASAFSGGAPATLMSGIVLEMQAAPAPSMHSRHRQQPRDAACKELSPVHSYRAERRATSTTVTWRLQTGHPGQTPMGASTNLTGSVPYMISP